MQVTEANNEGLKRTLKVVVGAGELNDRFTTRLDEIKDNVQLKGFRRGKVPVQHIRKIFGRSLMAEVVQQALEESTRKVLDERKERPAFQPRIELAEDKAEIENVIAGNGDLAFTMSFEVLPEIQLVDFSTLELERMVAAVEDETIDKTVDSLAERNLSYATEEGRAAEDGDQLTIDFVGRIDGTEFEGGKGSDVPLVLGAGGFIPGFAEGLKGAKAGEQRLVRATFPAEYPVAALAGKEAGFEVDVKAVGRPVKPEINDTFAKGFGVDDLATLKDRVRLQLQREYDEVARTKLKRQVLDALDTAHDFALPPTLVDNEFEAIWGQVTEGLKQANKTFEDEGKTEEGVRGEYRKIAERRVRLGLVLGEVGNKGKIEVTQDELRTALIGQARRFPGQERSVYDYYEKTPGALMSLRAPIFEDKVIDYIVAQANPTEKKVSREELLKPLEDEEPLLPHVHHHGEGAHAHDHDHDHHHGHDHDHDHDHQDHTHGPGHGEKGT